jgi:hypothetical protein
MPNYEEIVELVTSKGCTILTQKEDLPKEKVNETFKIKFISSCDHESCVAITNLKLKNTGVECNKCMKTRHSKKLKNNSKVSSNSKANVVDYTGFKLLSPKLEDFFDIIKTNEGCLADLIIKPKNVKEDKWLMLQMKTTQKLYSGLYNYNVTNKYIDCIMVLICLSPNKIWVMPYDSIKNITKIGIGYENSKYNKYLVDDNSIITILNNYYNTERLYNKEKCLEPQSKDQKVEHRYRLLREKQLDFITYTRPELDGMVYDFLIGDKKFQEKVIPKKKNSNFHYLVLCHTTGNKKKGCYKLGDNDFYWIWCNGTNIFYVIPENIMFKYNLVTEAEELGNKTIPIHPYKTQDELNSKKIKSRWTYEYRFDLDNLDKDRLLNLLDIDYSKSIAPLEPLIIEPEIKPVFQEKPQKEKQKCIDCEKDISATATRCDSCSRKNQRKVERPSKETLLKDRETMNFVEIGKKYGVRDNTIRKWLKQYAKDTTEVSEQKDCS